MTAVVDRVAADVAALKQDAGAEYRALVESLADGEDIGTGDVLQAIEAAGKTVDELKADVRRLTRRRDLATVLAGAAEAEADHATATRTVDAIAKERDAALAGFNERINAAAVAVEQATGRCRAAKAARAELLATSDPAIRARITALNVQREPAVATVARYRAEVDRLAGIAARPLPAERDEVRHPYPNDISGERQRRDEIGQHREAVEARRRAEEDLVLARGRLDAADANLQELLAEIAREQALLLVP